MVLKALAMPQIVGDTDFGLEDPDRNRKVLRDLLSSKSLKELSAVTAHPGSKIYTTESGEHGRVFVHDLELNRVVYYVQFVKKKILGKPATRQIKLWRDPTASSLVTGITKSVFFQHLLPIQGALVSDGQQTMRGREFWLQRMDEALASKYNVYVVDLNTHKYQQLVSRKQISNIRDDDTVWGLRGKYQARVVVISDHVWPEAGRVNNIIVEV